MTQDEKRKRAVEGHGPVTKAVVIQGSPRGKRGYTDKCLQRFLDGMREEGIDPEIIYLHKYNIKHCIGCFSCWVKTPGVCVQKDDMALLLEKLRHANLIVYAQPLYVYTVPGLTKNFLDRCIPAVQPWLIEDPNGLITHPRRAKDQKRIVVLSVCGFPELDHFKPLVEMFRRIFRSQDYVLVAELLRPSSEAMRNKERLGSRYQTGMDALYAAGREIVTQGYVSQSTEQLVSTPFFHDTRAIPAAANRFFQAWMDYEAASEKGEKLPPMDEYLDDNAALGLAGMATMYNPEKAGDFAGIFQFDFSDLEPGSYYLEIKDCHCIFNEGQADNPDLVIHTPWKVWKAISSGELSGQEAFMDGKYTIEGDMELLVRLGQVFGD